MKKTLISGLIFAACAYAVPAFAAPGEYWEVTSRMEMEGMPFAIPGTTTKVCVAKGAERDPRKSAPNKDCEMTDVKFAGNKTSWKVHCDHNGDITDGTGEFTHGSDSYQGKMHMKSRSQGESMDMTMALSGKRIGGNCEPGEEIRAMQKQACATQGYTAMEWIGNADRFLRDTSMCPGKKDELCGAVSKGAPKNAEVYQVLVQAEKSNGGLIARTCKLNMASIAKSICAGVNEHNFQSLSQACPAEAKKIMEARRRDQLNAGRSFSGDSRPSDNSASQSADNSGSSSGSNSGTNSDSSSGSSSGSNTPASQLLDSAKKLKGMFGF